MTRRLLVPVLAVLAGLLAAAGPAPAQITHLSLTHAGQDIPVRPTGEELAAGRAVVHGLLATTRTDVTRPVTDAQLTALGQRGTLVRLRLARSEPILLLGLGVRTRARRLAAYVPPDRDDRAFVFLGRAAWERVVMVDLPAEVRRELRALRAGAATR